MRRRRELNPNKVGVMVIIISLAFFLLMAQCAKAQTIQQVERELVRQGIPCHKIVLAQARLETGNFTSTMCKTKHNLFGIKHRGRYASYTRWEDSIADYKRRISSRYNGGDYYAFLKRIGYASDVNYQRKVRHIVETSR